MSDDQIRSCSHDAGFGWPMSAVAGSPYSDFFLFNSIFYCLQIFRLSDPCVVDSGKLDQRVG